jgi:hypothetical protein
MAKRFFAPKDYHARDIRHAGPRDLQSSLSGSFPADKP